MSTWDDIFSKAKDIADYAGKKTGDMVEISKLKLQISQLNSDIKHIYVKLGNAVYTMKKGDFENPELVDSLTEEIDLLVGKRIELEKKLAAAKKMVHCSACGHNNPAGSAYCLRCGNKIADKFTAQPEESEDEE